MGEETVAMGAVTAAVVVIRLVVPMGRGNRLMMEILKEAIF